LVDLIVIFAFTKPVMSIIAKWNFYASGHPLSGLSRKSSGIEEKSINQVPTTGMEA